MPSKAVGAPPIVPDLTGGPIKSQSLGTTVDTVTLHQGATYRVLYQLLEAIRTELECREAPACRYDVIVSQSPTQRGADLRGPGGSQGRVWVRAVAESSPASQMCPTWLWVDIEVGVLRCHQTVASDDRSLPTEDVYTAEVLRAEQDRQAVTAAAHTVKPRLSITGWRPYGPQSHAVGSLTEFRFRRRT